MFEKKKTEEILSIRVCKKCGKEFEGTSKDKICERCKTIKADRAKKGAGIAVGALVVVGAVWKKIFK